MSGISEEKAKFDQLASYICEMKDKPGPLMPVMQKAQDIFGALTFEVQQYIAEQMQIPMSDI